MKTVTLRDANHSFARCVREVEAGEEYVITRNGRPVARLIAEPGPARSLTQQAALARTRARMQQGWPIASEALARDALHER